MGENLSESAVSWAFLLEFSSKYTNDSPDITTEQVVENFVLEHTSGAKNRYIDIISSRQVGSPTFFVSHCRSNKFSLIVQALKQFIGEADPSSVFLWIDIFAVRNVLQPELEFPSEPCILLNVPTCESVPQFYSSFS
jgi:hypothetical protein